METILGFFVQIKPILALVAFSAILFFCMLGSLNVDRDRERISQCRKIVIGMKEGSAEADEIRDASQEILDLIDRGVAVWATFGLSGRHEYARLFRGVKSE